MGLLKLGSIYKKKSKKETHVPALPTSKPEPLPLELNLNLNNSSSIDTPVTSPQQQQSSLSNNSSTLPAGSGSLFDDIFAELGTKPTKDFKSSEVMDSDFSLALALSQQLEIDQDNMKGMTGPTTKMGNNKSEKKVKSDPTFLLGDDSIYSSYLRGISSFDNNDTSLSTSMFDSILNKNNNNISSPSTSTTTNNNSNNNNNISNYSNNNNNSNYSNTLTTSSSNNHVTQVVLDSDISDSDEDSKHSDDSEDETMRRNGKNQQRVTKGVRPIMERRTQNSGLLAQRKIDNWSNRVDPEINTAELNESMIERMKDRHRSQVKLAALRNQQMQQQDDYNMMGYPPQHMVPQAYVPPAMMPLSPTTGVLQHPGLIMDPVQMYYSNPESLPLSPLSPLSPTTNPINPHHLHHQHPLKSNVPSAFLPNPSHTSLALPHPIPTKEDEPQQQQQQEKLQRKSYFSRINGSTTQINNTSPPPTASSSSNVSSKHNSSTATLEQIHDEDERGISNSPVPIDTPSPVLEEQRILQESIIAEAEDADCEHSADESEEHEPTKSSSILVPKKKRSMRKLRQTSQHEETQQQDSSNTHHVRPSRSSPNLKKSKKKSNNNSRASSRRNSQDYTATNTPSEANTPPVPHHSPYLAINPEESLYHVPRSSSQHQLHQQQLQYYQNQQHRQSLRHMKSEPELPRRSNSNHTQGSSSSSSNNHQQKLYQQQQFQLNMEWERMQNYQREQILKKQQPQQNSFVPMYPMYPQQQMMSPVDPSTLYPHHHQQQQYHDPYQAPAYNMAYSKNKTSSYYHQTSR